MTEHLLTPAELTDVFERHMTRDFPQAELKPLDLLLNLQARGLYYAYLFREGEQDVGYALLVAPEGSRTVLLDYLAILPEFRCKGLGGRILARLQAACAPRWQALTLEVEHPAEAPDEPMAVRRLGFTPGRARWTPAGTAGYSGYISTCWRCPARAAPRRMRTRWWRN